MKYCYAYHWGGELCAFIGKTWDQTPSESFSNSDPSAT